MLQRMLRRGVPGLVVALTLLGAVPANAAPTEDPWRGIWSWLTSVWMADDAPEGERGPEADPNG